MLDGNLIFIDSFQLMSEITMVDVRGDVLNICPILLIICRKMVFIIQKMSLATSNLKLITRKGVYPYDYMDDFNKFKEEGLPSIENDHDYNQAEIVWKKFKCKAIGDYHDL